MLPDILKFASENNTPEILIELTWILVNISYAADYDVVKTFLSSRENKKYDVIKFLIDNANYPNNKVKENSFLALSNLWQESHDIIQIVIESSLIDGIIDII